MDSGTAQSSQMVQQFKETGHPIFTSTSALSRGILKQKRGRSTIHSLQRRFCEYGTLVSNSGVINSIWQIMKKRTSRYFLWTMEFWPCWCQKWKCWCLLRTWHLETRCKEARASEYWKRGYRWHTYVKKRHSSILWQQEIATNFDQMMTMDRGN